MTLSNGCKKNINKVMRMKKENEEELNMINVSNLLTKLINDKKVRFKFYNNSFLTLDLLQICYNKNKEILELEFRNVMGEYLKELKEINNERKI